MSLPPFERVVAEHGPAVLRVCRALLGPADAEDAWSETFLHALEAYPSLRPGSNLRGWLVTIAHRKAIDLHRRAKRRPLAPEGAPDEPAPEGAPDGPRRELSEALAALPVRQRQAVTYHHVAGLPYAEVAELMGGSEAAARRAAADGIAALRKTYARGETP
ncbi:MAG TPA: sigma-70 family RNA polymerase sigma factor [Polyangiaceae bacterium]|nr:sigma-70 family RNA polymerase sigma factor [Polyangiaceae bacterium]